MLISILNLVRFTNVPLGSVWKNYFVMGVLRPTTDDLSEVTVKLPDVCLQPDKVDSVSTEIECQGRKLRQAHDCQLWES